MEYFGTRPQRRGTGLACSVLQPLCAELAADGFIEALLMVYADNRRAGVLYEQFGWQPQGSARPHPRTGNPEQRYRLMLPR